MVKHVSPQVASHILRTIPADKAFLFAKKMGAYTGEVAFSMTAFLDQLRSTSLECIDFHLYPRPPDFERWIRETLDDAYLANQITKINRSITGEALRQTILTIVEDRLEELHRIAMTRVKGIGSKYATQLIDAGIRSVKDLAQSQSTELAKRIGVSEKVTARWIHNANQSLLN